MEQYWKRTTIRCPTCKKQQPGRAGQKYCSKRCMGDAWIKRALQSCPTCRRTFEIGSRNRRARTIFCSKRCRALYQEKLARRLSPTEAAYLAAMVDGEGSVVLLKRPDGSVKSYRLVVGNTYVPMLQWCQRVTGIGSVNRRTLASKSPNHKACWSWEAYGVKAGSVLRQIIPFMQEKRERAVAALEVVRP